MKTLIIGKGEVGSSLMEIVGPYHETFIRDIENVEIEGIEVLHICYPYSDKFVEITRAYVDQYKPKLAIINSSVKVGTTDELGKEYVYSPVRGRHPNLADEMRVYPKFVSGRDEDKVELAFKYFKECNLIPYRSDNPKAFEFCKLISNIHMGLEIAWRQEIERMLGTFSIEPEDYEEWEKTYSEGYLSLDQKHLIRPRMRPGKIGGHCIIPCMEILSESFNSDAFKFIKKSNDEI